MVGRVRLLSVDGKFFFSRNAVRVVVVDNEPLQLVGLFEPLMLLESFDNMFNKTLACELNIAPK